MDLKTLNKQRWDKCHVYAARGTLFEKVAKRIEANKTIYKDIEKATGVPWWFVGIVHYRESNLNLNTQLAQGDPLHQTSRHVPAGRGPFDTFKDGAIDALVNCHPYAAKNTDWSIAGALTMFEKYNGLGYARMDKPSPYVWAGTDQYSHGKYVSDGKYVDSVVDSQLGCAGLMKYLGVGKTSLTKAVGSSTAGAGALIYTMWDKVLAHPYIASAAFLLAVTGIVLIVKYLNRKKLNNDQVILPEHLDENGRLGRTDLVQ